MPNRFELVDEVQPDAITVWLAQRADGQWARVYCPTSALPSLPKDMVSQDMAPKDALGSAVKLANTAKLAIVIMDPDGVWKKEWGDLYRYDDEIGDGEVSDAQ
ncbi:MAG TPA: hypothetical protein VEK35_08660 [Roseiarcus sp.]|nr:hypothetical protein [Roseiarcus sp.]